MHFSILDRHNIQHKKNANIGIGWAKIQKLLLDFYSRFRFSQAKNTWGKDFSKFSKKVLFSLATI